MLIWQKTRIVAALLLGLAVLCVRGATPVRAQNLPPFPDFQTSMEQALKSHGLNPQHQAFHFVILLNTVSTQGPVPQGMRNILEGLLRNYLMAPASGTGDMISFTAFEMHLRPEGQVWNQPFSTSTADALLKSVPDRPQDRLENGGHDVEGSVLEAINHVNSHASDIIIVLSDTEISHTPLTEPNYSLEDRKPNYTKRLAAAGFEEVARAPLHGNFTGNGSADEGTVWYRIYLPTAPQALASLPAGRAPATQAANRPAGQGSVPTSPIAGTANQVPELPAHDQVAPDQTSGNALWPYISIGMVFIALGSYLYWLFQPRTVQIGSATGYVRFQHDVFVGNAPNGSTSLGRNAIQVPEAPAGQKIGVLRLSPMGTVTMRGTGRYKIEQGQVVLTATPKKVVVRDGYSKVMDLNVQSLK